MSWIIPGEDRSFIHVESQITIAAPIATVWAATVDLKTWPSWCPTIRDAHLIDGEHISEGSHFRLQQPFQRPRVWRVDELKPPYQASWSTVHGGPQFQATHLLHMRGDNTVSEARLSVSIELIFPAALARPILKTAISFENRALKRSCEQRRAKAEV